MFRRKSNPPESPDLFETPEKSSRFQRISDIKPPNLSRTKIVAVLLVVFIGTIVFMSLGSSETNQYQKTEGEVGVNQIPDNYDVPGQSSGSPGGFNFSGDDFGQLPGFNPPADMAGAGYGGGFDLPDGSSPNFGDPGDYNFGDPGDYNFGDPNMDVPSIEPPSLPNPSIDPPSVSPPSVSPPSLDAPSAGDANAGNVSLPSRSVKGRNLAKLQFFNISKLDINLPGFGNIKLNLDTENVAFILVLFMVLYLNKSVVPQLLKKLEEAKSSGTSQTADIFIKPSKKELAEIKRARERAKRLLVFKDHVDELIKRSEKRLESDGTVSTIVTGYHELDHAFGEFSKLKRTKDLTPLEHARTQFETGEIDNNKLKEIVRLFYLTRYGHRMLKHKDGMYFIDLLAKLVIKEFDPSLLNDLDNSKVIDETS
ncbi:MAG: hypothetical protein ACXAD7_05990 [Candidatus Kariarchaeaceae archaeon]|jgi:hypothetical protein